MSKISKTTYRKWGPWLLYISANVHFWHKNCERVHYASKPKVEHTAWYKAIFVYTDLDHLAGLLQKDGRLLKLLQMIRIIWNGRPVAKGAVYFNIFLQMFRIIWVGRSIAKRAVCLDIFCKIPESSEMVSLLQRGRFFLTFFANGPDHLCWQACCKESSLWCHFLQDMKQEKLIWLHITALNFEIVRF